MQVKSDVYSYINNKYVINAKYYKNLLLKQDRGSWKSGETEGKKAMNWRRGRRWTQQAMELKNR